MVRAFVVACGDASGTGDRRRGHVVAHSIGASASLERVLDCDAGVSA